MRDREPTVRGRELGDCIRRAMREASLSSSEVARQLGWSDSRVSRLLSGKRGGSPADVISVLSVCGVTGEERDRLIALSREHEEPNWFQLATRLRTLIDYENKATAIRQFECNLVPGLIQTEGYVRALMKAADWRSPEEVDKLVASRLGRQKLLFRLDPPASPSTSMSSPCACQSVAGRSCRGNFTDCCSCRCARTCHCALAAHGVHAAVHGSFRLMEFAQIKPLVYLDTQTSSIFLETSDEVRIYRTILARLREIALDEAESREVIAALAVELYADGGDHDPIE